MYTKLIGIQKMSKNNWCLIKQTFSITVGLVSFAFLSDLFAVAINKMNVVLSRVDKFSN